MATPPRLGFKWMLSLQFARRFFRGGFEFNFSRHRSWPVLSVKSSAAKLALLLTSAFPHPALRSALGSEAPHFLNLLRRKYLFAFKAIHNSWFSHFVLGYVGGRNSGFHIVLFWRILAQHVAQFNLRDFYSRLKVNHLFLMRAAQALQFVFLCVCQVKFGHHFTVHVASVASVASSAWPCLCESCEGCDGKNADQCDDHFLFHFVSPG